MTSSVTDGGAIRRGALFVFGVLLLGLAGCVADVSRASRARAEAVNEERLRADVARLVEIGSAIDVRREGATRRLGPGNLRAQADKLAHLRGVLEPLGYAIEIETFDLPPRYATAQHRGMNLIATKRGTTQPDRVLELGAHYDTMSNPGADDNSSGVAGALEVARLLAQVPLAKTVRFCFFDFEELGMLGSAEHVRRITTGPKKEKFEGVLVFEMIGYAVDGANTQRMPFRVPLLVDPPRTGNFIAVLGDMRSGPLGAAFERAADRVTPPLRYFSLNRLAGFVPDAARSDHAMYWKANLPGVMLTDTANFRNPHYHKATDLPETLNFAFMAQVVRATTLCLLEQAGTVEGI